MTSIPEFKNFYTTNILPINSKNKVECKLPILEEEAQNLLKIDLTTSLVSVECLEKELKYNGRGTFNVVYKSENAVKKCEVGVEYSFKFTNSSVNVGDNVLGRVEVVKCSVNILNGIVVASAFIEFNGEVFKENKINYFQGGDNLLVKNKEINYVKEICKIKKEHKLEDEFDLSSLIGDIISHEEKVLISEIQCGINSVIIDGDVELNGITMPLGGEINLNTFSKKIPFRIEVDCEDVIPNYKAVCSVSINNSNLKVYVDESKSKSAISIDVNLAISGIIFEDLNLNLASDVYSLKNKLKIEYEDKNIPSQINYKCLDFNLSDKLNVKLQENSRLNTLISVKIESKEFSVSNNTLTASGTICACVFSNGENLEATEVLIPFSVNTLISSNEIRCKDVQIVNACQVVKEDELFLNYTIKLCFVEIDSKNVKLINGIEVLEEIKSNDSAISVYIPSCGDTLWDICKVLCVQEQTILDMNKELEFPLSGDERIVVYREINK